MAKWTCPKCGSAAYSTDKSMEFDSDLYGWYCTNPECRLVWLKDKRDYDEEAERHG